LKEDRQ